MAMAQFENMLAPGAGGGRLGVVGSRAMANTGRALNLLVC